MKALLPTAVLSFVGLMIGNFGYQLMTSAPVGSGRGEEFLPIRRHRAVRRAHGSEDAPVAVQPVIEVAMPRNRAPRRTRFCLGLCFFLKLKFS